MVKIVQVHKVKCCLKNGFLSYSFPSFNSVCAAPLLWLMVYICDVGLHPMSHACSMCLNVVTFLKSKARDFPMYLSLLPQDRVPHTADALPRKGLFSV